jgi:hypothetical protein
MLWCRVVKESGWCHGRQCGIVREPRPEWKPFRHKVDCMRENTMSAFVSHKEIRLDSWSVGTEIQPESGGETVESALLGVGVECR